LSNITNISDENLIATQFLNLLTDDDIESFDYLIQSIPSQLSTFWDSVAYLFFTNFFLKSSSFFDQYSSTDWFNDQIRNQIQFCENYIIQNSKFELTWIIPILKIIYDPESIPGQIDYLQEFINFLDTPIKGIPRNFGIILLEFGLEFIIRAYNIIIQKTELTEKLTSFLNWTDQLLQNSLISQDQHDYFGVYLSIWFPRIQSIATTEDKEKFISQNLKICEKLESEINRLLPFEQLRLKLVYSKLLLDDYSINPDKVETAKSVLETTYKTIMTTHFSTGSILDYALMLTNRIEVIEKTIENINDDMEKENQASEAVNQSLILIQILSNLPREITATIGLRLIGGISEVLGYLKGKELIQASQTIMSLSEKTISAGKLYLNEPSYLSGELFKNLARAYLSIGVFASIESRHKLRALENSQEYIKQSIAIYEYLASHLESIDARIINLKTNYEQFKFLVENNAPEIEFLSILTDTFLLIREVTELIISQNSFALLLKTFNLVVYNQKFIENNIPGSKEADFKRMTMDIKRWLSETVSIGEYPDLGDLINKL
jgi:hypothetical protein